MPVIVATFTDRRAPMKPIRLLRQLRCLVLAGLVASCGLPPAPDMRGEFFNALLPLGVIAFYPLREDPRLGQVYLVDKTDRSGDPAAATIFPTTLLVTEALVPQFEAARAARLAAKLRFPCSSNELATQLTATEQTRAYYRQADCPPPAAGAPASLPPLELAGLPSYRLAAIDNFTGAAAMPSAFANFLAAVGVRESKLLQVEAAGVEIAELPEDTFASVIRSACTDPNSLFHNKYQAGRLLDLAHREMTFINESRYLFLKRPVQPYHPSLYMLKRVYYLRGIRYVLNDSRAYSAALQAAANANIPKGATVPALSNITVNASPPAGQPAPTGASAEAAAQMAALQAQIDAIRSALGSTTTTNQFSTSFARATARGIEFVDLFQRPMAFGYWPLAEKFDPAQPAAGFSGFCEDVGNP